MTNFQSNIYTLAKIHGALKFIFGSRKVMLVNGDFKENGKIYRIYSFFKCVILIILMTFVTVQNTQKLNELGMIPIYLVVIILSFAAINLTYFLIMISYFTNGSTKAKNIFNTIVKVDIIFKNWSISENDRFYKKIVIYYGIFISLDICLFIIESNAWNTNEIFSSSISCFFLFIIELELINFFIEINEIARRLEIVNTHLIEICTKKFNGKINFYINRSFLSTIWKRNHKPYEIMILNHIQNYGIDQLLRIFFDLSLGIKELNFIYGKIVSLTIFFFEYFFSQAIEFCCVQYFFQFQLIEAAALLDVLSSAIILLSVDMPSHEVSHFSIYFQSKNKN